MACTACGAECTNTAEEVAEMFAKVRGWRRRARLLTLAGENWRCNACLDEAERED